MTGQARPKRVVVVDADNPMEEIHGEFFWREDHERALASAREAAYREGYEQGFNAAASRPQVIRVRNRRWTLRSLLWRAFVLMVVLSFAITLIGSMTR